MGQVFTWTAIRQGHVPRLPDFVRVVDRLRREIARESSIIGSIGCGSVFRGDMNLRSDIDVFVLYAHNRESEAFAFMQGMSAYAKSLYVPLGCIPCDTLVASTRMHHLGPSFRRHLERCADVGGLLKGDPLELVMASVSEKEELESYLRVKMYNLQEAWAKISTFSEERLASYYQKLLEAPMHVARKMLAHEERLDGDSKAYVCAHYRECMPRSMADSLDELVGLDRWYTVGLSEQLEHPQKDAYYVLLTSILTRSEYVLAFIRENLAFIAAKAR